MNIDRRGLEIGPIEIFGLTLNPTFHWYGLLIVLGIALAALLAAWMAKRDDKDPDVVWDGLLWVVALGVIFARAWHVLFPSISMVEAGRDTAWYLRHFFDLNEGPLVLWRGGLSIFGAVIGGVLGVMLYAWRRRIDLLAWLDTGAVVLPLGQAIGRWGNYVNEELYGTPTDLPWACASATRRRNTRHIRTFTRCSSTNRCEPRHRGRAALSVVEPPSPLQEG